MPQHHVDSTRHESNEAALTRELGEAKRQRDSLQADREGLARRLDAAVAERDRLRDAARAFLLVLDRTNFSAVALKGPTLDALREAVK